METIKTQQILVPKKVYIGDLAELRITFSSQVKFSDYSLCSEVNLKNYTIENIQFVNSDSSYYQLIIKFIPWKTGEIDLPDIELAAIGQGNENSQNIYKIETQPVQIVSLIEQNQVTGLKGQNNPLLLPGTAYKIYGTLITFLVLLLIIIRLIIKRKSVALFIKNLKIKLRYKKNQKKTLKILSKLDFSLPQKEIASIIQKTMRNYLEIRFEYPFSRVVTSQLVENFSKATCDLASHEKMEAVGKIAGIFTRTDYIRYGNGTFLENEPEQICNQLKECIETLEFIPPKQIDIH